MFSATMDGFMVVVCVVVVTARTVNAARIGRIGRLVSANILVHLCR